MTLLAPDPLALLFDPIHQSVLDVRDGIERVVGDRQLYLRTLERFRREYRHAVPELRACLARQDRDGAHRLAHTLKGAAGLIGAGAVGTAAAAMETVLRLEDSGLDAALARLAAAMQALLTLLEQVAAPPAAAGGAGHAPRPLGDGAQLLRELDILLDSGDGAAVDLVDQAGPALQALLGGPRYEQLAAAVHGFDFEAARATLAGPPAARSADTAVNGD